MSDWDGLNDDDENQAGAQPGGGGYEPLDGHVDLTQRQAPFQSRSGLRTPAPLDGSVDLTPAPMTGLLGNFKALPFDGTSERWLYRLPSMGGPGYDDDDGPKPWIISRPIDMTGGTSDGYFRTLGDPSNGPPAAGSDPETGYRPLDGRVDLTPTGGTFGADETGRSANGPLPGPRMQEPVADADGQADATVYPAAQTVTRVANNGRQAEVEALRNPLLGDSTRPGTEGYRRDVYDDGFGHLTTGIGHKVVPADGLHLGQVVSAQQVERFYQGDAAKALAAAHQQAAEAGITDPNFIPHLAEVNYQLGTDWRNKFKGAWSAMKSGDYKTAIDEVAKGKSGGRSLWYTQSRQRVANFQAALGSLPPKPKQ